MLRYAAVPLALAAALTGGRLGRFWDASGAGIRRTVAAAAVWALIPGLLAAMIVEINHPQLRYLAGRLDRAGYLRAAGRYRRVPIREYADETFVVFRLAQPQ